MNTTVKTAWFPYRFIGLLALAVSGLRLILFALPNAPGAPSDSTFIESASGMGTTARSAASTSSTPPPAMLIQAATTSASVTVTVSPKLAAIAGPNQTQQFTATVAGTTNTSVTWSVAGVVGGNSTVGTITPSGLYTPPAAGGTHAVKATSVAVPTASGSAMVFVTALTGVFTYHNDTARDGANTQEFALKPSTLNTTNFGKLFACPVNGAIYAQPLWVKGVSIGSGIHNVVFVATQHDSIYAFDADASPCMQYWRVNLLDAAHGGTANEKPVTWNDVGNCFGDIYPEVGVTGTPVIDRTTNTIYLVSASETNVITSGSCSSSSATFYHRLHALDLVTGSEKFNAPVTIAASVPGTGDGSSGGIVRFDSQLHHQRSGLALSKGIVYVVFAAHEDATPYHGWVISYKATDVQQQVGIFNTTPNGIGGADGGIWAGGGAPAVDSGGDVYITTGNGVFDEAPPPPNDDYGDSILRLHPFLGTTMNGMNLSIKGWFTPYDQQTLTQEDGDLGSGAAVLLPNQSSGAGPTHLLTQVGKEGVVYLIDRDNMGQFNPLNNDQIVQSFPGPSFGLWGTPALWHNNLYTGGQSDSLKQFSFDPSVELFNTAVASQSAHVFRYPGTVPSVSAQGGSHGIVWALDTALYGYASPNAGVNCSVVPVPAACSAPAILHAYDAANLALEYWNSALAANNRDQAGNAVKFVPPTVVNGKVYVGTRTELDVYGLFPN